MSDMSELDNEQSKTEKSNKTAISKENHSEIERRRRLTMNSYIYELSELIVNKTLKNKKLNKLSVLKNASTYLAELKEKSQIHPISEKNLYFLNDIEAKTLIFDAICGFEIIINCNNSIITYVSNSVEYVLACKPEQLVNDSILNLIHPQDLRKMEEQLSLHKKNSCQIFDFKKGAITIDISAEDPDISYRKFYIRMKCIDDPSINKLYFCPDNKTTHNYENYKFCLSQRTLYDTGYYILAECCGNFSIPSNTTEPMLKLMISVSEDSRLSKTKSTDNSACIQLSIDGSVKFIEKDDEIFNGFTNTEIINNYLVSFFYNEDQSLFYEALNLSKNDQSQNSYMLKLRIMNKNGTFKWANIQLRCIRSAFSGIPELFNIILSYKIINATYATGEVYQAKETLAPNFYHSLSQMSVSPTSSVYMSGYSPNGSPLINQNQNICDVNNMINNEQNMNRNAGFYSSHTGFTTPMELLVPIPIINSSDISDNPNQNIQQFFPPTNYNYTQNQNNEFPRNCNNMMESRGPININNEIYYSQPQFQNYVCSTNEYQNQIVNNIPPEYNSSLQVPMNILSIPSSPNKGHRSA